MKKIVVFGNQKIATDCISLLMQRQDISIVAVIGSESENDRKNGYTSLKEYCFSKSIDYYQPESLDENFERLYKSWNIDIAFSIYYRNIISKSIQNSTREGIINLHPSLLPKYRGPVPVLWTLLNNELKTGVTLHYIDEGIDTGDIIDRREMMLPEDITGFTLHCMLMDLSLKLFQENLDSIISGNIVSKHQDHNNASYYGKFNQSIRTINWFTSSQNIDSQVRALTKPYTGARTFLKGEEIIIWRCEQVEMSKKNLNGPGKVIDIIENNPIVSCVDGFLKLTDFHTSGAYKLMKGMRFDVYI